MRIGLAILCLAATAVASPDCPYEQLRFNRQQGLVKALRGHTEPIPYPEKVDPRDLALDHQEAKDQLANMKVATRVLTRAQQHDRGITTSIEHYAKTGDVPEPETIPGIGKPVLIEVLEVRPKPESDLALTHEKTPALMTRMKKMGVRFYVDSTLIRLNTDGIYAPEEKAILIRHTSDIYTLIHEFTHAEYDHYKIDRLVDKIAEARAKGQDPRRLLEDPEHAGFGAARLKEVLRMVEEGYPHNSIDEAIAVESEIELRAEMGMPSKFLDDHGRKYAAQHKLNDLVTLAAQRALTEAEQRLLGQTLAGLNVGIDNLLAGRVRTTLAVTRYQWTANRRDALKIAGVGAGLASGPVAALTVLGVAFNPQLKQLIVWCTDGTVLQWSVTDDEEKKPKPATQS